MNHDLHDDPVLGRATSELWRDADAGVRAPAGFDERLFARLEREAQVSAARPLPVWRDALPWWVRAAGERHVALASILAGAMIAWWGWLLVGASVATSAGAAFAGMVTGALTPALRWFTLPGLSAEAGLALAACLAPGIAWVSYRLARVSERWMLRAAHASAAHVRGR